MPPEIPHQNDLERALTNFFADHKDEIALQMEGFNTEDSDSFTAVAMGHTEEFLRRNEIPDTPNFQEERMYVFHGIHARMRQLLQSEKQALRREDLGVQ